MEPKIIVITGASSGIGAALARQLAARELADVRLVVAARRADQLAAVVGDCKGRANAVVTDVTKRAEVEALARAAIERHGHIDVWINNAGRGISREVSQLTDADLDEMMAVNLKSALYGMQAVLPHFQSRRRGHIINVSSVLGRVPLAIVRSAYSASKHALNALTANLRMELRTSYPDIKVSLISPGVVATEFGNSALHGGADSRQLPMAQPVDEVAAVIIDVIDAPRADVYSRPQYRQLVASYYAAEDLEALEGQPPFAMPPLPHR